MPDLAFEPCTAHPADEHRSPSRDRRQRWILLLLAIGLLVGPGWLFGRLAEAAVGAENEPPARTRTAATPRAANDFVASGEPSLKDRFVRAITLQDYHTRVVLLGTLLLGMTAGVVGTFMLLRKRSLVGDVVGHASLPGVCLAFLLQEFWQPGQGRSVPGLLLGAFAAGLAGVAVTVGIRRWTRIKDDAAQAIVLSIFFGAGIALLSVVQRVPSGSAAGLQNFIFGQAGLMLADDVALIAVASLLVLLICSLLFKEFSLLAFDEKFATAQGWPVLTLDLLLMGIVVGVAVIGLQSVGLLLIVALLILPAAAARFWTDQLLQMTLIAAVAGGLSAFLGVLPSAMFSRWAAGPSIVLVGAFAFSLSLLFGGRRGLLPRWRQQRQVRLRVGRDDLLRSLFEIIEDQLPDTDQPLEPSLIGVPVTRDQLVSTRSWNDHRVGQLLGEASGHGLVELSPLGFVTLTAAGASAAFHAARQHRLWELYLLHFGQMGSDLADRTADQIEHFLEPDELAELERRLASEYPDLAMPRSPHSLGGVNAPETMPPDAGTERS